MLDRLSVTNFKVFAEADIALARYTLLSGLNSSGKSTALQALALLRQSQDALDDDEGGLLLNGDLVELGTGQDVLHEGYVSVDDLEPRIGLALRCGEALYSWAA